MEMPFDHFCESSTITIGVSVGGGTGTVLKGQRLIKNGGTMSCVKVEDPGIVIGASKGEGIVVAGEEVQVETRHHVEGGESWHPLI
jgi:hypothetical protein